VRPTLPVAVAVAGANALANEYVDQNVQACW